MLSTACPKPANPGAVKRALERQTAKQDKAVYIAVDERDKYFCRACCDYEGIDIHRHHLRGRAYTTVHDVAHICESCHDRLHVRIGGKTLKVYGDADQRNPFTGVPNGLTVEMRQRDGTWIAVEGR